MHSIIWFGCYSWSHKLEWNYIWIGKNGANKWKSQTVKNRSIVSGAKENETKRARWRIVFHTRSLVNIVISILRNFLGFYRNSSMAHKFPIEHATNNGNTKLYLLRQKSKFIRSSCTSLHVKGLAVWYHDASTFAHNNHMCAMLEWLKKSKMLKNLNGELMIRCK